MSNSCAIFLKITQPNPLTKKTTPSTRQLLDMNTYFYNDVYNTPSLWSNTSAFNAFSEAYNTLVSPTPNSPLDNIDDWEAAAHYLVYPSRGSFASEYRVPLGALAGPLPGYIAGLVPIPDKDVDCAASQCSLVVRSCFFYIRQKGGKNAYLYLLYILLYKSTPSAHCIALCFFSFHSYVDILSLSNKTNS